MIIRPATVDDHPTFARLFLELAVPDPPMPRERFAAELMPTTWIAVDDDGAAQGYLYFQLLAHDCYVRQLVTAPSARRRGVGRALLLRLAAHARAAGKARWRLNVKPENAAAIALYTRMGFALSSRAEVVRVPGWPDALPLDDDARVRVRRFTADEDRDLGPRLGFVDGQLALLRAHPDRVLAVAQREGRVVGGASFDPHFPGAFPFRADDLAVAGAILRFCAREAPTSSPWVQLVIEEHPALTAALVARGGTVMLETHHYEGEIPAETT